MTSLRPQGFVVETKQANSREGLTLVEFASKHGLPFCFSETLWGIPEDYLPYGGISWMEGYLGAIEPQYYPPWAQKWLKRKVWTALSWPLGAGIFIKPADRYKRFTGFVTVGEYCKKKKPPFICSEKVHFVQEWRYLIANGRVLSADWYDGSDESERAPELPLEVPSTWCGALDMGRLANGELALIEAQHPYSIGWYGPGDKNEVFIRFLWEGWKYLINNKKPR